MHLLYIYCLKAVIFTVFQTTNQCLKFHIYWDQFSRPDLQFVIVLSISGNNISLKNLTRYFIIVTHFMDKINSLMLKTLMLWSILTKICYKISQQLFYKIVISYDYLKICLNLTTTKNMTQVKTSHVGTLQFQFNTLGSVYNVSATDFEQL